MMSGARWFPYRRTFPFADTLAAMASVEQGKARGRPWPPMTTRMTIEAVIA
jgi:hypothetical protein